MAATFKYNLLEEVAHTGGRSLYFYADPEAKIVDMLTEGFFGAVGSSFVGVGDVAILTAKDGHAIGSLIDHDGKLLFINMAFGMTHQTQGADREK